MSSGRKRVYNQHPVEAHSATERAHRKRDIGTTPHWNMRKVYVMRARGALSAKNRGDGDAQRNVVPSSRMSGHPKGKRLHFQTSNSVPNVYQIDYRKCRRTQ